MKLHRQMHYQAHAIIQAGTEGGTVNARERFEVGQPRLEVTCWCERRTVVVPAEDVRNGLTRSCGARECEPR